MALKMILIVAVICAVQLLPVSFSTRLEVFDNYYKIRDEFGEVFSLYGLRSKLLNHTRYYRIQSCFNKYAPKYKEAVKIFVENLETVAKSLHYDQSARPLQNLISILKTYPTNLEELINSGQYDLAGKLVYETTRRVIYFDVWFEILMDRLEIIYLTGKYSRDFLKVFQEIKSKFLGFRKKAKAIGWETTINVLNCITTLVVYLIPVNELHTN